MDCRLVGRIDGSTPLVLCQRCNDNLSKLDWQSVSPETEWTFLEPHVMPLSSRRSAVPGRLTLWLCCPKDA